MTAYLVPMLSLVIGLVVGYVIGVQHGAATNWLRPTVQRQQKQLNQAWATIETLQGGDDWAERGIGR